MKTKVSPAVVGLFVLGALGLILVALLSFGGINFLRQPQRFEVYFNESIHGLDLGSPVKLRGVRIGRVVDIKVRYNPETNSSRVAVLCELSRNVLLGPNDELVDVTDRAELEAMIDRGLRAQLQILGLATGLLYVELDFFDRREYPIPMEIASAVDVRYARVPAVPSSISEFQSHASEILNNMRQIDFAGLAKQVDSLLKEVRGKVVSADIKAVLDQWAQAGAAVTKLTSDPELGRTIGNLNGAIDDLRGLIVKLDATTTEAGPELTQTLTEAREAMVAFSQTATTLRSFINAQQNLGGEAGQALVQLGAAAEAVGRLADFLERNPNALLTGRNQQP